MATAIPTMKRMRPPRQLSQRGAISRCRNGADSGTSVVVVMRPPVMRLRRVQVWNSRSQDGDRVGVRAALSGGALLASFDRLRYLMRPASFSVFSWKLAMLSSVVLASC